MSLKFDSDVVTAKQEAINTKRLHKNLVAGDTIIININGKSKQFTIPIDESAIIKIVLTHGIELVKKE